MAGDAGAGRLSSAAAAMFTGIASHVGVLVTAVGVLTGAATMVGGAVAADPNQDDQFLALLDKEEIPAVENVPSVIAAGHTVCRRLDGGMPVDDIVDAMRNDAYAINPRMRLHRARVTTTMTRFITAAVGTYCPYDQGKIASITPNPAPGPSEPALQVAGYVRNAVNDAHGTVLALLIESAPSGEIAPPNPPQIPAPPPPTAHLRTPPRVNAAPPAPEQPPLPPPEQKPPPPLQQQPLPAPEQPPLPQQAQPSAAPQPGGAGGSSSSSNGGGDPAEPPQPPHMPPGFVRLAP
jgi:hypothetical protein